MTDNRQNTSPITITARWDHDQVPLGQSSRRGLLIDITAAKAIKAGDTQRPPVNLALVLDRSGSMSGGPLAAAIEAANGVAQQLNGRDRLSIVAYDDRVDLLTDALPMDAAGRKQVEEALHTLSARGTTDLAGGWLQGARCVAAAMEEHDLKAGHVVLLTDGRANRGECDPEKLAELSGNLAERGVTSTCVGIGASYSPLQVAAIAEAGQGELHQSSEPGEIIEVLAGEIGEQTQIVARNFSLKLRGHMLNEARQLTRYGQETVDGDVEFLIGNLVGGQKRQVALLVEFEPQEAPLTMKYLANGTWLDPETALREEHVGEAFTLDFVPGSQFDPNQRDKPVAETIATMWLARQGWDAMMLNEEGDLFGASASVGSQRAVFDDMVADLDLAPELQRRRDQVQERVRRRWDGVSKKEAMLLARKRMRAKPDFRAAHEGREWTDVDSD